MTRLFKKSLLVVILGMSLFSGTVYSQDIIVNSAKMRATNGIFIVGVRSLTVSNDSGVINNSGTIYVSGDITNSGRIISDGVEIMNGDSDQTITGVHGVSYLGNVSRVQPANRNIIAGSNLSMRTFNFGNTNGFVNANHLSGYTVRILDSSDVAIKNFSQNKYFDLGDNKGTLERRVATLDTVSFPVGNSSAGYRLLDYHPINSQNGFVGLKVINGSPSTSPSPEFYTRVHNSGFENSSFGTGCIPGDYEGSVMFECLTEHYWNLTTPSTSSEYFVEVFNPACFDELSTGAVGPRRVLRVPGSTPRNDWFDTLHVNNVVDLPFTDNFCLYADWTRVRDTIPGGIYRGGGLLAIATGSFYPLSVEFSNLSAFADEEQKNISLNWKTVSEMNADRFEVLRSITGTDFQKIGYVNASGNSNVPRNYQFIDESVEVGIEYYYQLKQIDYDERFDLSNIVSAQLVGDDVMAVLQVYPNPTHGLVYVSQNFDSAILSNIIGQQIKVVQNSNSMLLNELPAGTYILQVKIGEQVKSFKVQKL